ncbi:class I tRNA ligase family protein [Candidatus Azambacteria bacterium]|nr:class I tRNA ligase family protein [Candidatus Azambacteria bacterium]
MQNEKNQKSNIANMEENVIKFWKESGVFQKTLKKTKNGKPFVFYEGPPGANGRPGIHHMIARAFKDVFLRYKTMRGFYVERKAGWDTHGLPVELEVEKRLGIKSKPEIEKYGIEKFNNECKKVVWTYQDEWEKMTERLGYWLDLKNAYITYAPEYIESLWWVIKRFWEKGLLAEDYKVIPFCTRCGTGLSSHEVAQGYQTVKDRSVYVKFKTKDPNEYFLVWTTTPWTLPANVALAVNKSLLYARVKLENEILIVAKERVKALFGDEAEILGEIKGLELAGLEYEQLLNFISPEKEKKAFYVVLGDFVSATDGSGVVHIAPAFGEDDMQMAKENDLPVMRAVKETGDFIDEIKPWVGKFVKEADPEIIKFLEEKGLVFKTELYEHEYPFCWRCKTPLIYFAKQSWFVNTTKVRDEMIKNNRTINWIPEYLKDGRFGEWLKENKDWAFSRNRYWGTPLPVWRCESCGEREVFGSLSEISKRSRFNNRYFIMRHGQSEFNLKNKVASSNKHKNPLTKKGILEVKRSAKKLKNVDIIISSPFKRTLETAEIVAKELGIKKSGIIKEPLIQEINTGIFDGGLVSAYHAYFNGGRAPKTKKEYFSSILEKFAKRPKKGESLTDLKKRMAKAAAKFEKKYKDKNILIVSHEYPLWMLETALSGWSNERSAEKKAKMRSPDYIKNAEVRKINVGKLPLNKEAELDLHRPYVDKIKADCKKCNGEMKRAPEVCDVWFDSGAMPFAQLHYPFKNKAKIEKRKFFPADYISEAVDQTRGWFYTLLAVSTLLGFEAPYKNVISLGHVVDARGKKMSKSLGNVINPSEMADKYGMDSIRWYFYIANSPGDVKKFDEKDLAGYQRKHVMALLNVFNFLGSYVDLREKRGKRAESKNILDKWIIARLNAAKEKTVKYMEEYNPQFASREIAEFVDDLTNWYIRRSRRRFQYKEEDPEDFKKAKETLIYVFEEALKLTAPFTPFVADHIWLKLGNKNSIHLENFPKLEKADAEVLEVMKKARSIVSLALEARAKAGIKIRQPLKELRIKNEELRMKPELLELIRDEVNVKNVTVDITIKENVELDTNITKELKEEGMLRDLIRNIQEERKNLGLTKSDFIKITFKDSPFVSGLIKKYGESLKFETVAKELENSLDIENAKEAKLGEESIIFKITPLKK